VLNNHYNYVGPHVFWNHYVPTSSAMSIDSVTFYEYVHCMYLFDKKLSYKSIQFFRCYIRFLVIYFPANRFLVLLSLQYKD
jgi:hypothetical protein